MISPTLHLNGTSSAELIDQLTAAMSAVNYAARAVAAAAPNARDYYVQGPDATARALSEHRSRLSRLQAISDELAAILDNVLEQDDARSRRQPQETTIQEVTMRHIPPQNATPIDTARATAFCRDLVYRLSRTIALTVLYRYGHEGD